MQTENCLSNHTFSSTNSIQSIAENLLSWIYLGIFILIFNLF